MDSTKKKLLTQIELQKKLLSKEQLGASLNNILGSEKVQSIINEYSEFRERIYTPFNTLSIFIKQVINPDKSCKNAIAGMIMEQTARGETANSGNTGPYCKARTRLSVLAIRALVQEVGISLTEQALNTWNWRRRPVKLIDGTMLTMADTDENQEKYPQVPGQKKGLGFPILRLVVIMSLATGAILDYAMAPNKGKKTGEHGLLRGMLSCINVGDVILADCYYPSFFCIAEFKARGADGVFHAHAQRNYDFRRGIRLGKDDHIMIWKKPQRPTWMDKETYDAYPKEIQMREFRLNGKTYVTTFLDHKKYIKIELVNLYSGRWQVEINLGNIKTTMNMNKLSCKTPEMVEKEIGVHFLAYNIIRALIAEACRKYDAIPNKVSFKGTIQLLVKTMPLFSETDSDRNARLYAELLRRIVKNKVGNRPGRAEPRAVKQRPKPFVKLKVPRYIAKARLIKKKMKRELKYAAAA